MIGNFQFFSVQEDQEDDLKDFEEKTSCILFPNHSFLIEEKLKSFLNSCNSDKIEDRIYLGRELLSIADKLEPGFSVIRGNKSHFCYFQYSSLFS